MSMQSFTRNLDADFHKEAQNFARGLIDGEQNRGDYYKSIRQWRSAEDLPVATVRYFGEQAKAAGIYADTHERQAYQDYWLSRLNVHPMEFERGQKVRQYADDRWPLEKIFEAEGAAFRGETPATVQKAFETTSLQTLFPIFFDVNIIAGILRTPMLDQLVVDNIPINSHTANHIVLNDSDADGQMGESGEGGTFVQLLIKEAERSIKLRKFGGTIMATYEAVRLQRLPFLARALERIGRRFTNYITDFAIATLIDGDGAGDGAATTVATAVGGTPTYSDWVALDLAFSQNYDPNVIVAPVEVIKKTLNMAEFKDPLTFTNPFVKSGVIPLPMGMALLRWDVTGKVSTYTSSTVLMLDNRLALYQYTEGGLLTETDRIIDGGWNKSVTSTWTGFAIGDRAAVRLGTGW